MWALCMALERPERVRSVVGLGIPAVALAGMRGDPYFRAMTTPGVRALVSRAPAPKTAKATRRASTKAMGRRAVCAAARRLLRAHARRRWRCPAGGSPCPRT